MRNFSRISNVEFISTPVKQSMITYSVAYIMPALSLTFSEASLHAGAGSNMKPRPRTVTMR